MKIIGQSVPPELATLYNKLVCTGTPGDPGVLITKLKPNNKKSQIIKPTRKQLRDYENAVDNLIDFLTRSTGIHPIPDFRRAQIENLKLGIFDPDYWATCEIDTDTIFANAPGVVPWSGPRNYAYPDPANQPSIPVYANGIAASGLPYYEGATIGTVYQDVLLRWRRIVFKLRNSISPQSAEPLFVRIGGTITAQASTRGSHAMLSAIIKRWIVPTGDAQTGTLENPTIEPLAAQYRYRIPASPPPYFNYTHNLRLIYSLRSSKYESNAPLLHRCVLLIAPMPMMGKRYNNNTAVSTTLDAEVALWQIKKPIYATWNPLDKSAKIALTNNNLTASSTYISSPAWAKARATVGKSAGKWYWEIKITQIQDNWMDFGVTLSSTALNELVGDSAFGWSRITQYPSNPIIYPSGKNHDGNRIQMGGAIQQNDVIGIALDMDAGTIATYLNGVAEGILYSGISGIQYPAVGLNPAAGNTQSITANFGETPFAYSVPSGFNAGLYE